MKKEKSSLDWIKIFGAREHNLKSVSVDIPKNKLTVITGPSGSGKSSLALDVLYTEGKRRYMESLSSYARQFLGIAKKPDFDKIEGLCPSIAIEQKTVGHNPRSTVGTITEIYDHLRILYARIGKPHCPDCSSPIAQESPENITTILLKKHANRMISITAPLVRQKKGEFKQQLLQLYEKGYYRFVIDDMPYRFNSVDEIKALKLAKTHAHSIDLLIDKLDVTKDEQARLQEDIEKAFALAHGTCKVIFGEKTYLYSSHRMCLQCLTAFPELEPRFFSFNSPIGACQDCNGLGIIREWAWQEGDKESWKEQYPDFFGLRAEQKTCKKCLGKRLNKHALAVVIGKSTPKNIMEVSEFSIKEALTFFSTLKLSETDYAIARGLVDEIAKRLQFLHDVGLSYLSLNRTARTLSGGEGQRIRLATQIGSALSGVLYILDEPSIGLHQRDNDRLIQTLKALRDQGNTVLVVEHDLDTMVEADYLVDMGPAAGVHGGTVTACGTSRQLGKNHGSLTGAYLSGRRAIKLPTQRRRIKKYLTLAHADKNNLKNVIVAFPLEVLTCVSGVSGSGKSTLVLDELVSALQREFDGYVRKPSYKSPEQGDLEGAELLDALVVIDQTPIGRTPRSNPATYLGIFNEIRNLFSQLPESQARGYKAGRFSFNVKDGRCFECSGDGTITVSMQFLADVTMMCKACKGQRYNAETLAVCYKGKNIAQVLDMTALEALEFFAAHKQLTKRLALMCDVGLGYIKLGQSSTTLSGGEAQRIKLVDELAKRGKNALYILDEPTTGLHSSDIEKLLEVLNRLIDKGNSMIVIEHNLDVLKTADYIIDLGPEGGDRGGKVVARGVPEEVAQEPKSHTGRYLKKVLVL